MLSSTCVRAVLSSVSRILYLIPRKRRAFSGGRCRRMRALTNTRNPTASILYYFLRRTGTPVRSIIGRSKSCSIFNSTQVGGYYTHECVPRRLHWLKSSTTFQGEVCRRHTSVVVCFLDCRRGRSRRLDRRASKDQA